MVPIITRRIVVLVPITLTPMIRSIAVGPWMALCNVRSMSRQSATPVPIKKESISVTFKNFCQPFFHFTRESGSSLAADGMHIKYLVFNPDGNGTRGKGNGVGQGNFGNIGFQICFKGYYCGINLLFHFRMQGQKCYMQG